MITIEDLDFLRRMMNYENSSIEQQERFRKIIDDIERHFFNNKKEK